MSLVRRLFPAAPPALEIELTGKLLAGSEGVAFVGLICGAMSVQAALNADAWPAAMLVAIAVVSLLRVRWLRRLRQRHGPQPPDLATSRRSERHYALGSFVTSALIGAANLYALTYRDAPLALLVICGLCCYVFSLILRTAMRPLVCLPSIAIAVGLTLAGLSAFLHEGHRLAPAFALAALTTLVIVMVVSSVQLASHLYRATLAQLLAQRDLLRFARQDPLTGLDNRLALRERFEVLGAGPARPAALLYLDLDRFKPVNDLHGHQVGDALLREVALRLNGCIRPGDGAFRIGGDEFVVLLARVRQRSEAAAMARRLLARLSEPYVLEDVTVRIGASVGIALADVADADLDDLTATADAALYDAKRSGRGTFQFGRDASSLRLIA